MKKKFYLLLICALTLNVGAHAQFGKLKGMLGGKKDTTKTADTDSTGKPATKEKSGGSFFSKAIVKVAKVSSNLVMSATGMLVSTDDLNSVTPSYYTSINLYPASVGTVEMDFFKGWKSGGNMIGLFFTQKEKAGFAKIDGDVVVNGQPATYGSTGVYTAFSNNDGKPATVQITTKNGQKTSFTLPMSKAYVKIKSINGQTGDKVSADLTKDMVIELEKTPGAENVPMTARLVITQLGLRGFFHIANFKGADEKLVIPAAAFRNINITPGGKLLYGYSNCYITIERNEHMKTQNASGVYPSMEFISGTQDGRFLTLTKDPELNPGLHSKGEEKFAAGEVTYDFFKPNAFLSRPFAQIKNLGVLSFAIRGTTYVQGPTTKSSNSFSVGSTTYTSTTTTTTWATFPTVSQQVWDGLLAQLYPQFTAAAAEGLSAKMVPLQTVANSPAYQQIQPYSKDDETTSVSFTHSYQNSKMISAFLPISDGYGVNSVNARILKETGTEGLMKFTFDLQIAIEKGKPVMIPKLAFEIVGGKNGEVADTKFCSAEIVGKGQRFPSGNITVADMQKIVRDSDLLTVFRKGLQEIKAKEKANGDYDIVWALQ